MITLDLTDWLSLEIYRVLLVFVRITEGKLRAKAFDNFLRIEESATFGRTEAVRHFGIFLRDCQCAILAG